jgi:hypothetical protein
MERGEPVAFLSYVRADDTNDNGNILRICQQLRKELESRTGAPFPIFVDREDIDWGENWRARINESLESATLLIPVLSPRYFVSTLCRDELNRFLEREATLGRSDLVLPLYYIDTLLLEDPHARFGDPLAQEISKRQYIDWRSLRLKGFGSSAVRSAIVELASRMERAFKRGVGGRPEETVEVDNRLDTIDVALHESTRADNGPEYDWWWGRHQKFKAELKPGTAYLVIDHGPDSGQRILIDKPRITIGRSPNNDIVLHHQTVSKQHAEIIKILGRFHIHDLNSNNGVLINGTPVEEHLLEDNDILQFGEYFLVFVSRRG